MKEAHSIDGPGETLKEELHLGTEDGVSKRIRRCEGADRIIGHGKRYKGPVGPSISLGVRFGDIGLKLQVMSLNIPTDGALDLGLQAEGLGLVVVHPVVPDGQFHRLRNDHVPDR
jgi:hypothetical protein